MIEPKLGDEGRSLHLQAFYFRNIHGDDFLSKISHVGDRKRQKFLAKSSNVS